jgi:hypothetical protein
LVNHDSSTQKGFIHDSSRQTVFRHDRCTPKDIYWIIENKIIQKKPNFAFSSKDKCAFGDCCYWYSQKRPYKLHAYKCNIKYALIVQRKEFYEIKIPQSGI